MEEKTVILKAIKKNGLGSISRIPSSVYTVVAGLSRAGYQTGLTETDEKYLEKQLGYIEGTLSKRSPFWKEYAFKIPGESDFPLYLSEPQMFLDYSLCKANSKIANSEEEINTLTHDFVLIDAEEQSKKELTRITHHDQAIISYTKMSVKEMKDALKLLGFNSANMSENLTRTTLRNAIDENPNKFNGIINDPDYQSRVFIKDLELNRILNKNGTKYYFGDINNVIGNTMEEVIDYLNDKSNNEVKIQLKKALAKEQNK